MDIFDEGLVAFWQSLNQFNVKYIMVGGIAINLNGYQRATDDVDVWKIPLKIGMFSPSI